MDCSTRPDRRVLGVAGEYTARLIIEEAGLRVLECNWHDGRRGELDIIARDDIDRRARGLSSSRSALGWAGNGAALSRR